MMKATTTTTITSTMMLKTHEEGDGTSTSLIAQADQAANLEDESLLEYSEYRHNDDDEEEEGDGSEGGHHDASVPSVGGSLPITVEQVPKGSMKHPLQHRWTLWYDNPGKKTTTNSWADFLQKVTTFDTVEDFWRIYNNIKPASALVSGSSYHLFKDHIEPKWEDIQNSKGGRWTVPIFQKSKALLDQMWLYAVLACIGETFECTEDVCGIVLSIRKSQDRLCLWTKDSKNEHNVLQLGRQLKLVLELSDGATLGYQPHEETGKSSHPRNSYEV